MIDQLRLMAIFQTVAELGSFRAAAKKLNLSPSVISHHVTQLEGQLGLPLLYRSTRRISLTEAGQDLLKASQQMTSAAQAGLTAVNRRVKEPTGTLSITLNTASAHHPWAELHLSFARTYPEVQLAMNFTDERVPLEGSKFDVAIRGSNIGLNDSSYKARKLGSADLCLFASPEYAHQRPLPTSLDDLSTWDWIKFVDVSWAHLMTTADGTPPTTEPRIKASCDSYMMAKNFVLDGQGFMVELYPIVAEDLKAGRLVQLLPDLSFRPLEVYAVYPANASKDSLAHLYIDFILQQSWIADLGWKMP